MLKTFAVSTLLLGSAIAFAQPAAARDRDDFRNNRDGDGYSRDFNNRDRENRERGEWRQHERFERRRPYGWDRFGYSNAYRNGYGNRYSYGDRFSEQRQGFYDRFGNWCWY